MINNQPAEDYLKPKSLAHDVVRPLKILGQEAHFDMSIRVQGGGYRGQIDAIRLGIARALLEIDSAFRKELKNKGFLRRDPRVKERKKYGLKKARKAPQYTKR